MTMRLERLIWYFSRVYRHSFEHSFLVQLSLAGLGLQHPGANR